MTPEERANNLVRVARNGTQWKGHVCVGAARQNEVAFQVSSDAMAKVQALALKAYVAATIRDAEEAERVAAVADIEALMDPEGCPCAMCDILRQARTAIRARGNQ